MPKYILALDQGTSSSRAIAFEYSGNFAAVSQKEFKQIYPQQGWVEHDPEEIWQSQLDVMLEVIRKAGGIGNIAAIGITNQRETSVIWDRKTGKPICNAIVWQDRRTAGYCDELKKKNYEKTIQQKTGLVIDAYFSGTKVKWMLDNIKGARDRANKGELAFGTIDSWLIWKLTNGKVHATDVSNASRTMLFNIHKLTWDDELLKLMDISQSLLPEIVDSSGVIGNTCIPEINASVPISGVAGDQQAALFGQQCTKPGMVKNTYGTGCFIMMNTGSKPVTSKNKLLTTIAWKIGNETTYALEGSIFVGGAAVQWLRDGLGLIKKSSEIEALAEKVKDNGGIYFVPALTGMGAPYWDAYARGTIIGLTRGTNASHIARATLEAIAFQTYDVLKAMEQDAGMPVAELRVDGGASANNLLMQFQSDVLQTTVARPVVLETTALGAAYLAGLATGFWKNMDDTAKNWQLERNFKPTKNACEISGLLNKWEKAVERAGKWEN
jgi:glycerol kinase